MILDAFLILCGVCLALLLLAELGRKPIFGFVACILLLVGGYYILDDGIQIKTGEITTYSGNDTTTGINLLSGNNTEVSDGNLTTQITLSHSTNQNLTTDYNKVETTSYVYSDLPVLPFYDLADLLGLIFMLVGMGGFILYAYDTRG